MLDYYVVISLSAKLSEGQPFRIFNLERLAMFKALHGQQDRRNWRPVPLEMLDGWLHLFPEVSSKNETILPRQRSGRTNILSGTEDLLSRRLACPVSAHFLQAARSPSPSPRLWCNSLLFQVSSSPRQWPLRRHLALAWIIPQCNCSTIWRSLSSRGPASLSRTTRSAAWRLSAGRSRRRHILRTTTQPPS